MTALSSSYPKTNFKKNIKTSRFRFLIISLKRNILPMIFLLFTICLIVFSNKNLLAAKSGLILWANNVVPSLFPFFVATELLNYTNIIDLLEKFLTPIMKPLFNVSGSGAYPLIMGTISGYPIGAKIVSNFRDNNICSKEECERLLSFTNNSSPLFIIGSIGISMFYNSTIGILLFITHLLGSLSVGIVFRFWKYNTASYKSISKIKSFDRKTNIIKNNNSNYNNNNNNIELSFSNLGEILTKSIISATNSVLMIGGFIVLFSIVISILNNSGLNSFLSAFIKPIYKLFKVTNKDFSYGFITGLIEITNGVMNISNINYKLISTNIISIAVLLGFSGICIFMQVYSIISKTDISIKPYIIGKILHGIFAGIYTYIFIKYFPIFNFNI